LPEWKIIHAKMLTEGKATKVLYPTPMQLAKNYPEIKCPRVVRKLKPFNRREIN
jgi:hypothetical protein